MARRTVTLEQKAEVVATYQGNGNALQTARETGFTHPSVLAWSRIQEPEFLQLLQEKRLKFGLGFANLTEKLLDRYSGLVDTATLDNKGVSLLGICADKFLLFSGQPTEIVETRVKISVQEAESKLARLLPYFPDRASALEALRAADDEAAAALEAEVTG